MFKFSIHDRHIKLTMSSTINWDKKKKTNGRSDGNNFSRFRTCREVVKDPFWRSIFEFAGKGELPEGFTWLCKEKELIYNDGRYNLSYKISSNTIDAADEIIEIFKKHKIQRPDVATVGSKLTSFKDVKGHNLNALLSIYMKNECKTHNLNPNQYRYLTILITRMILRGDLTDENIEFKNGIIVDINNITFDGERYVEVEY
jgi:hypothetical protein